MARVRERERVRAMRERYFEDWVVGERVETARLTITRERTIAFAREYDPQAFHLDDAAAAASTFGRLCASGWQTASTAMRLVVETGVFGRGGGIGVGVDELRWLVPVYPDDTIYAVARCVETRASESRPRGIVRVAIATYNQHDVAVMTHVAIALVARRSGARA